MGREPGVTDLQPARASVDQPRRRQENLYTAGRAYNYAGKNWARIGHAATRADGHYTFRFRPTGRKDYQVRWTGSSQWHGSVSRIILIRTR